MGFGKGLLHFWHRKRGFDRNTNVVPPIVEVTCTFIEKHGLQTEGIFRVSAALSEIKALKKKFDNDDTIQVSDLEKDNVSVHVVSGVLKQFFIEPEESILTEELYDAFLEASIIPINEGRVDCIRSVVGRLPPGNRLILKRLLSLLDQITQDQFTAKNKMTSRNLGIVFGPTLLRKRNIDIANVMNDTLHSNQLIETMVENYEDLFQESRQSSRRASISRKERFIGSQKHERFEATLNYALVKLAETRLKEVQQLQEINDVAKVENISPEEVDIATLSRYYGGKVRSNSSGHKKLTRNVSKVWVDFFTPPEENGNSETPLTSLDTLPEMTSSTASANSFSQIDEETLKEQDPDADALVESILNKDGKPLEVVQGYCETTSKKSTLERRKSFYRGLHKLSEEAKAMEERIRKSHSSESLDVNNTL